MPLVSILKDLKNAQAEKFAIPLYDTFDMISTDAMIQAAEDTRSPLIIALYDVFMDRPNAKALSAYIRVRAEQATVPVSLMLDHGKSFEQCMQALSYGFTDVMLDASKLPFEENVAQSRMVVRAAHEFGAGVEAELGHVGRGEEDAKAENVAAGYTEPADAVRFVEETGVDILAIAVGTVHGMYDGEFKLNAPLVSEIRELVDQPLVLHGGSGCTDEQFRDVIERGITKINVATDLYRTTGRRLAEAYAAAENPNNYNMYGKAAFDSLVERCTHYLEVFGAPGHA